MKVHTYTCVLLVVAMSQSGPSVDRLDAVPPWTVPSALDAGGLGTDQPDAKIVPEMIQSTLAAGIDPVSAGGPDARLPGTVPPAPDAEEVGTDHAGVRRVPGTVESALDKEIDPVSEGLPGADLSGTVPRAPDAEGLGPGWVPPDCCRHTNATLYISLRKILNEKWFNSPSPSRSAQSFVFAKSVEKTGRVSLLWFPCR